MLVRRRGGRRGERRRVRLGVVLWGVGVRMMMRGGIAIGVRMGMWMHVWMRMDVVCTGGVGVGRWRTVGIHVGRVTAVRSGCSGHGAV